MGVELAIKWSETSASDLQVIFDFYLLKSPTAAVKIVEEILEKVESIDFAQQYQKDEINRNYRRLIILHFKVLYRFDKNVVYISRIFDTRQDPKKQQP